MKPDLVITHQGQCPHQGSLNLASPHFQSLTCFLSQGLLKARYTFTKESKTMDMMGTIHSDIFFQDRFILNGVNLRLKLNRAKNYFCLVSSAAAPNFKVVITGAILYVRKVKVTSSISLGHAAALKQTFAK